MEKFECVGHVQKRLGTNLRKLKTKTGNKKLSDGKTHGERGRLTLKEIDRLQICYGLAIGCNIDNLDAMKNGIDATLRHRLSSAQLPNYTLCPTDLDTWCKMYKMYKILKITSMSVHFQKLKHFTSSPFLTNSKMRSF